MLEKWKKYQAKEVQSGNDENGNRLISLFARDYQQIMGTEFCPSCNDFAVKFQNFIIKLENMSLSKTKNSGFALKAMFENITLHGSQAYYNNANLTDESAIHLLENHPKGEALFEVVPENWQDLKTDKKPEQKNEGVVTLFEKDFSIEEAKELFKNAGIETKATTVKGLEDKFEKLSDDEKKALEDLIKLISKS